jgi:hypothetical protein
MHFVEQHFFTCVGKYQQHRTFVRQDQLLQHINGVHLESCVSKTTSRQLLSLWMTDNPSLDASDLVADPVVSRAERGQNDAHMSLSLFAEEFASLPGRQTDVQFLNPRRTMWP